MGGKYSDTQMVCRGGKSEAAARITEFLVNRSAGACSCSAEADPIPLDQKLQAANLILSSMVDQLSYSYLSVLDLSPSLTSLFDRNLAVATFSLSLLSTPLMWCDVWVWASALQPHTHTITQTHTLPITCTCCCDET